MLGQYIPASVVFPSRTGGNPHTVEIHVSKRAGVAGPIGTRYATCNCPAGRTYWMTHRPCWAMLQVSRQYNVWVYPQYR